MIALRPVVEADVQTFYAHQSDPEAAAMVVWTPRDPAAHAAHWARIMADPDALLRTVLVDGVVAGNVVSWTHDGRRFVGYWFDRAYWGRGVGTAAVRAFLDVERHRPLYADPFESNAGSVALLRKCGFVETGRATGPEGTQVVLVKEG